MNIAILSPNKNAYSETFIHAHKRLLSGKVYYYYGGRLANSLEGSGKLFLSRYARINHIIKGKWSLNKFSQEELLLLNSFKLNNIELVLAESGVIGTAILPIIKQINIPLIVHFHGMDASVKSVIASNNNYTEVFKVASYVVVVSKKMERDLLNLGCKQEKIVYNPCGPRKDFFNLEPNFINIQFIAVGRFVNKKAPYYLIIAFRQVVEKYSKAKLIMAGNGDLLETCKNLVKFYKLEENIIFPGVLTSPEIQKYMEGSLAFVQHSITAENGDTEGTPVGILEAGAASLPVISTNHAGIKDVVIDGESGFLVDEHDVDGMAKKMIFLIDNLPVAKEMGLKNKTRIKENFSLEKHIEILDQLIAKSSPKNN